MRRLTTLVALFLTIVVVGTPAPAAAQGGSDSLASLVDAVFREYDRTSGPGCTCGVMRDGALVFAKGYGMANLELNVPLSPGSVFYIASTSKQFTAASIALLVLDGRIDLDADIHTYLPDMGDLGHPVTVRELVHHTSGVRDYFGLLELSGQTERDYFNNERVYDLLKQQRALNFVPGTRYLYSNSNYVLLAEIVEHVTGETLRQFAEEHIFGPLGMRDTHYDDDSYQVVRNRVTSYGPRRGGGYDRYVKTIDGYGDGNVLTTVGDLAKWDEDFYSGAVGGRDFVRLMLTPGQLQDGDTLDYAFGLILGAYRGLATVSHGGAFMGFRTQLTRFPAQHFSVAVLCNAAAADPTALANAVADVYLAGELGPRNGGMARPQPAVEVSDADLERFIGHYWDPSSGVEREIAVGEDGLVYRRAPGNESPLGALDRTRFLMLGVPVKVEVAFPDDAAGRMTVSVDHGTPTLYERFQPASPTTARVQEYVGIYESEEGLAPLRVAQEADTLVVSLLHHAPQPLRAIMADRFASGNSAVRFVRSGGRVTGLVIDAGRILGVRYTKRL